MIVVESFGVFQEDPRSLRRTWSLGLGQDVGPQTQHQDAMEEADSMLLRRGV